MQFTNYFFILNIIFIPFLGFSQYTHTGNLSLKVYTGLLIEQLKNETQNLVNGDTQESSNVVSVFQFGQFSTALAIYHGNNHFSEIEIAALESKRQDNVRIGKLTGPFPGKTSSFSLSLRYGYHFSLLENHSNVVQPYIGFSATPFIQTGRSIPESSVLYDSKETTIGLRAQVCPRLIFSLTEFLALDLNVLITSVELTYYRLKLKNSTVNAYPPSDNSTQLRWLPNRTLIRLGLGVFF